MSDWRDDYRQANDEGKMEILQLLYKNCDSEERKLIVEAGNKIYNRMRGRGPSSILDNISNVEAYP
jgi:hypothetical protein